MSDPDKGRADHSAVGGTHDGTQRFCCVLKEGPARAQPGSPPQPRRSVVVRLAEQLNRRAGLTVAVATQTRAQVLDVTNRAAAIGAGVALLGTRDFHRPMDLHPQAGYLKGTAQLSRWKGVVVATTARWLWVSERDYTAEVYIVDFSARRHHIFDVGSHLRSGRVAYGRRTHVRHTAMGPQGAYGRLVAMCNMTTFRLTVPARRIRIN